ncbi:T9SS type A sorting domain-containing protein [Kriegella sp. EG-1]|nr:T9SS type A sorting domain-containing protein [Flavobacteriaceae bacterium EG-1]
MKKILLLFCLAFSLAGYSQSYDIEITLGPQLQDVNGFYVIDNGNLDPTLSFDAVNSGGGQVTSGQLPSYDLIINTLESTIRNPASGGNPFDEDIHDFTLITNEAITVPVNNGIDGTFEVIIDGDSDFEADEYFTIEVSTSNPILNLKNADPDGVVRFNMRIEDSSDTATATLTKIQDGEEGIQDIEYRIKMNKTNYTNQDLVFDININNISTSPEDYTNTTQATIANGLDEVVFSIPINTDLEVEPLESLETTLGYSGAFASRLTVTQPGPIVATITDNTNCSTAVNFTDSNLEAFFLDTNNYSSGLIRGASGNLTINDLVVNGKVCVEKANLLTYLDLSDGIGITSLEGIEHFVNLEILYAQRNPIVSIDLRANVNLIDFRANRAGAVNAGLVEYVDLRGLSNLEVVALTGNIITELLLENNTSLQVLHVQNNNLTGNLDISTFENGLARGSYGYTPLLLDGNQLSCIKVNDLTNAQNRLDSGDWVVDDNNLVKTNCDEPTASITANDPDASEVGPDNGQFTVNLSSPVPSGCCPMTISYTVAGTALPGVDYTVLTGTVQIPIGETSAPIDIDVIDNDDAIDNETVELTLDPGSGYTLGTPNSAIVTITNSATIPMATISANDPNASEVGPDNGQFTIALSSAVPAGCCPLTINYSVDGTAIPAADYINLTGTVEIPIGATSVTIDINVLNNDDADDMESVEVTLDTGIGYTLGTPNSATVTITNSLEASTDIDLDIDDIIVLVTSETCEGQNNGEIEVSIFNENYTFSVLLDGDIVGQASFNSPFTINNRSTGEHIICLRTTEYPDFEQCFGVNIKAFEGLNVSGSTFDINNLTASYFVEGSKNYEVLVNEITYSFKFNTTSSKPIEVPLDSNTNEIIIKGISDCQGVFKESIIIADEIRAHPNPVVNNLEIDGIPNSENTEIALFSVSGELIKHLKFKNKNYKTISVPMYDIPAGVYLLKVLLPNDNSLDKKIIKK